MPHPRDRQTERFEYQRVQLNPSISDSETDAKLAALGEEGWDLVAVIDGPGVHPVWVFKRLYEGYLGFFPA